MSGEALEVRPATAGDAYALWLWANDEGTRAASFGRDPIPWSEHVGWLGRALEDPHQTHLVAELPGGPPVGSIRFDSDDDWVHARLSYVVAPEARGHSLSAAIVRAGVDWIRRIRPQVEIRADVMSQNSRSLRVFRKEGWEETRDTDGVSRFWLRNAPTYESDPDQG